MKKPKTVPRDGRTGEPARRVRRLAFPAPSLPRRLARHRFLLEELVKRDFRKKYKRTILGAGWSMLAPLLHLGVMKLVFGQFFGRDVAHYTTYLFCGYLLFAWFAESTREGMLCLVQNASVFSKINVPKYLFLLAKNAQTLLNFGLTLLVFLLFCALDRVDFTWRFLLLAYPVATLLALNLGLGLALSALFVFFRDVNYLWAVFFQLLMYASAIFYRVDGFAPRLRLIFACNPVYRHIAYVRAIVLDGAVPPLADHLVLAAFALVALGAGAWVYKRHNTQFLYYV